MIINERGEGAIPKIDGFVVSKKIPVFYVAFPSYCENNAMSIIDARKVITFKSVYGAIIASLCATKYIFELSLAWEIIPFKVGKLILFVFALKKSSISHFENILVGNLLLMYKNLFQLRKHKFDVK